ncbi:signal peptidase II [Methylocella sp.]|uniref:signal peptidase II n=1 Tax=Methylocella sp. TaxID=1978226 RepID=UPI0037851CF2
MTPVRLGAGLALATLVVDQANKLWLIFGYGVEARQPVRLTPFFDVVFAKNTGISYSLFNASTATQRLLLLGFTLAATAFLVVLLFKARTRLAGAALGLIIGGALGNAVDRAAYGYVADFYHFHVGSFSWYVFNLADVAIVAGVGLLMLEALFDARGGAEARGGEGAPAP